MSETDVDERDDAEEGSEGEKERQALEARAARLGWKPQDGFRGEGWLDAPAFIEKAESETPILRERVRKLDSDLAARDKRIDELQRSVETLSTMTKRQVEAAVARTKAEMKEAAKAGDEEAHERAQAVLEELQKQPEAAPKADAPHPDFDGWVAENRWYMEDIEASEYADRIVAKVAKRDGLPPGKALFDRVGEEVRKKFPDKFENQRRAAPQSVEEGRAGSGPGKSFRDIPSADRKAMERQADDLGIPKEERKAHFDEVAKIYWQEST